MSSWRRGLVCTLALATACMGTGRTRRVGAVDPSQEATEASAATEGAAPETPTATDPSAESSANTPSTAAGTEPTTAAGAEPSTAADTGPSTAAGSEPSVGAGSPTGPSVAAGTRAPPPLETSPTVPPETSGTSALPPVASAPPAPSGAAKTAPPIGAPPSTSATTKPPASTTASTVPSGTSGAPKTAPPIGTPPPARTTTAPPSTSPPLSRKEPPPPRNADAALDQRLRPSLLQPTRARDRRQAFARAVAKISSDLRVPISQQQALRDMPCGGWSGPDCSNLAVGIEIAKVCAPVIASFHRKRTAEIVAVLMEAVAIHSVWHDAYGYVRRIKKKGPGYTYAGCIFSRCDPNDLKNGQVDGLVYQVGRLLGSTQGPACGPDCTLGDP